MKPHDLKSMSVEELWSLHELVISVMASKISAEKARLEQRLRELGQSTADSAKKVSHARRPYPQVLPKYRNPTRPSETWAGRGKQPRWGREDPAQDAIGRRRAGHCEAADDGRFTGCCGRDYPVSERLKGVITLSPSQLCHTANLRGSTMRPFSSASIALDESFMRRCQP